MSSTNHHHQQKLSSRDIDKSAGFTLIEVLMAVVLVAILATIAVTQFTDFNAETKNATVRQSLAVLRDGIQKQYGQMRLRCGVNNKTDWPSVAQMTANDITSGAFASGASCTATEVTGEDKRIVAGAMPANPWSDNDCTEAERRLFTDDTAATPIIAGTAEAPIAVGTKACGWLYDPVTGGVTANTAANGGTPTENAY